MSNEIKGLATIFAIYFAGDLVSRLIGSILPSGIVGMLLLFVLLQLGIVREECIKGVCNFVLSNMMLLFIPVTAGVMVSYSHILEHLFAVIATLLISTLMVLITVGTIQQFIGQRWRR